MATRTLEEIGGTLEAIGGRIGAVAERTGPAVVGLGRGWGHGSGSVIAEGKVLTCAHNLRGEEATVVFGDGRREVAEVAGADHDLDVAVLSVPTAAVAPVEWATGDGGPSLGTPVLGAADPGGRGLRVTLGFVTSEGHSFRGPRG